MRGRPLIQYGKNHKSSTRYTFTVKQGDQKKNYFYSQFTTSDALAVILPTRFSASQMYRPSSEVCTLSIRSDLSSSMRARSIGIFPSSRRHKTFGLGSPSTAQWKTTLCPTRATTSCGSLLKNGLTAREEARRVVRLKIKSSFWSIYREQ